MIQEERPSSYFHNNLAELMRYPLSGCKPTVSMLSPLVSSSRVDCVRPPYRVISSFYKISLARLRLVAALKQYGLYERKREARSCVAFYTWISTERESKGQRSKSKTQFFCNGSFLFKRVVFTEGVNGSLKRSLACHDSSPGGFDPVLFISMKQLLSVVVSQCSSTFLTSS